MNQERQTWLGLLARANRDYLENIWATYNPGVPIQKLAGPETGLVQLNTQACKASVSFQFGEASCTRCVIAIGKIQGYAVHLGSDLRKAELAAYLDAFLQTAPSHPRELVLHPIRQQLELKKAEREQLTAATSVRFYTTQKT